MAEEGAADGHEPAGAIPSTPPSLHGLGRRGSLSWHKARVFSVLRESPQKDQQPQQPNEHHRQHSGSTHRWPPPPSLPAEQRTDTERQDREAIQIQQEARVGGGSAVSSPSRSKEAPAECRPAEGAAGTPPATPETSGLRRAADKDTSTGASTPNTSSSGSSRSAVITVVDADSGTPRTRAATIYRSTATCAVAEDSHPFPLPAPSASPLQPPRVVSPASKRTTAVTAAAPAPAPAAPAPAPALVTVSALTLAAKPAHEAAIAPAAVPQKLTAPHIAAAMTALVAPPGGAAASLHGLPLSPPQHQPLRRPASGSQASSPSPTKMSLPTMSPQSSSNEALEAEKSRMHEALEDVLEQAVAEINSILQADDRCILACALSANRYLAIVSHSSTQSIILGFNRWEGMIRLAIVVPVTRKCSLRMTGDGGFVFVSPGLVKKEYFFRPVSVLSMWSAVHYLYRDLECAEDCDDSWAWLESYRALTSLDTHTTTHTHSLALEQQEAWFATVAPFPSELDLIRAGEQQRAGSHVEHSDAAFELLLTSRLRSLMFTIDLDDITSKQIRLRLEKDLGMKLKEYGGFIDEQMIIIFGQMEPASKIFDHVYLGTEWNASNKDELVRNNVKYVINVTQEIDNFFPESFHYTRVPLLDEPEADLLSHWEETYRVLQRAKHEHVSVLVHCQMGISRSASTVIAYAMKAHKWSLEKSHKYVKERRPIVKPNDGFWGQLQVYEGIQRANRRSWLTQSSSSSSSAASRKPTVREYLEDMSTELGVYAAAITRHFPTVEELRRACAEDIAACKVPAPIAHLIAKQASAPQEHTITE